MEKTKEKTQQLKVQKQSFRLSIKPEKVFEKIAGEDYSFFLDSCNNPSGLGRFSAMGCRPFLIYNSRGRQINIICAGQESSFSGDPLANFQKILDKYQINGLENVFFPGGAVGYFSYDLGRYFENIPFSVIDDLHMPEIYFGFYNQILLFDHLMNEYSLIEIFPRQNQNNSFDFKALLDQIELEDSSNISFDHRNLKYHRNLEIKSNLTRHEYISKVKQALEYIRAGDIYQVNLSQRFSSNGNIEPYYLYSKLRKRNPAPFSAYLNFPEFQILSTSPERFLLKQGNNILTRPIKGTRPRHKAQERDLKLAKELKNSIKDRAENVMIVDLERNDLGKICQYGQVRVPRLFGLESFATVHHLVSEVEGILNDGVTIEQIIRATFPGGSITGAPKIRSMEIIDELEPTARGIYTGSLGYIGFNGNMDLNIVIRTILNKGNKLYYQVGGGIVADSIPEAEYQETLDKGLAIKETLERINQFNRDS